MAIDTRDELFEAYLDFFKTFQTDEGEFKYVTNINKMIREGERSLIIEYDDLVLMDDINDMEISTTLTEKPSFTIEIGSEALAEQVRIENPDYYKEITLDKDNFAVRFANPPTPIQIRDLRSNHVDSIRWLEGIVIRATEIKSIITEAIYFCTEPNQHRNITVFQDGIYSRPERCFVETCKAKDFVLDPRESKMIDWQIVTLQEKPEDLPPGASPKAVPCRLIDDIVNTVRPGDRVHLGGLVRTKPSKIAKRGQILTYDMWIDVNFIESLTKEEQYADISLEDEKEFMELAQDPKIHERLLESVAPAIYGLEKEKEATLLMLFGGVDKVFPDGFTTRGQSNILLVGDPGVAKSQLLRYVQSIAPRGLYTSGRGSTAAGLTAAIIRDPDTGEIALEAGALVLADRGICLIDEFDKMNENDRSAIHEAMEQHSYHRSTEIRLADGKLIRIGSFVDNLFEKYSERFIDGINCEILPISDLDIKVKSTDFDNFKEIRINRVSRHKAPNEFIRIKFGNGRLITVTPEHPIYTFNEYIITEDADKITEGMFVPAPRFISYEGSTILQTTFTRGRKKIKLPRIINKSLAQFLGYFVAEGFSYGGSNHEIGLSNSNPVIIEKMKVAIRETFNIEPIDYTLQNRTLRIVSVDLFNYFSTNFREVLTKSIFKRIPNVIFQESKIHRIEFLRAAFEGDGSVETETCSYNTSSKGLAEDYQDLLSTLDIATRIHDYDYLFDKNQRSRKRYKVYIRGDSIHKFAKIVESTTKASTKLQNLVLRSEKDNYNRDVLPPKIGMRIIECLGKLGIPYDGTFNQHLNGNYGITKNLVVKYITKMKKKLTTIKEDYHHSTNFKSLRNVVNYSQHKIAQLVDTSRGKIEYIERGGYSLDYRNEYLTKAKSVLGDLIIEIEDQIVYIEKIAKFRWLRVKNIEKISNEGVDKSSWVYDLTIEPTRNFVSQNMILHNTISVAKAGIVATLNARTGVLAAANPKYGRYEPHRTFSENVNLTPAILSRFDLVFILKDEPQAEKDQILASHILNLHRFHGTAQSVVAPMPEEKLKKYIAFAKTHYSPTLTEEATDVIEEYYVNMRMSVGSSGEEGSNRNRVTITARQLEGIVRMAEARSRAALRTTVTKHDALKAIELMQYSLNQIAIDPTTGEADIDGFYSGQTSSKRSKLTKLLSIIDFLYRDSGGKPFEESTLLQEAENEGITQEYAKGVVQQMLRDGQLYQPKSGWIKRPDS